MCLLLPAAYVIAESSVLPFPNKMHLVQSICSVPQMGFCGPANEPTVCLHEAKHFLFPELSQNALNVSISSGHACVNFILC